MVVVIVTALYLILYVVIVVVSSVCNCGHDGPCGRRRENTGTQLLCRIRSGLPLLF